MLENEAAKMQHESAKSAKEPEIRQQISRLDKAEVSLRGNIETLYKRLAPVVVPNEPKAEEAKAPGLVQNGSRTPLGKVLEDLISRFRILEREVQNLLSRLEI